jgi:tetratricopeptide (TPR) repeat protein/CHAT domain-containing protein
MPDDVHEQLAQLNHLVRELYEQGRYEQAIQYAIQARDLARHGLGEEQPGFAYTLSTLAELYRLTENYGASEPLQQQALAIRERTLGADHSDVARSLNYLGALYSSMGNYAAAEPLYRRALDIDRKALGEGDPEYATVLGNLGNLYEAIGNYLAAEPLLQQALDIKQRTLGDENPEVAQSLDSLAQMYSAMGDHASAEPRYLRALETFPRIHGKEHPSVATTLNNLAQLYWKMGNYAAAEPLFAQALEVYRKTVGEDHPFFITTRDNLARLHQWLARDAASGDKQEILRLRQQADELRQQGRFQEAIPLAEKQRDLIRQLEGGVETPWFATSLNNLGDLYRLTGNYAAAEPLLRQALAIYGPALGEEHPYFAASLDSLATIYYQTGNYSRAEPLYRQALEIKERALGKNHPEVASTLHNLALLRAEMGDVTESESLMRRSLEVYRSAFGEEHPYVVATRNVLAELDLARGLYRPAKTAGEELETEIDKLYQQVDQLRQEGRFGEAIPLAEKQRDLIRELEGGDETPRFATGLNDLGVLYLRMGNYVAAEPLLRQSLEITRRTLGEGALEYARSLSNLAATLREMGDYAAALPMVQKALEIARASLEEEDPLVATAMNNLAGLYMAMGNYSAAAPLYQEALRIRRRRMGEADPAVAELLDNLGWLCFAIRDYSAAEGYVRQALDVYRRAFGEQHPDVAVTLQNLAHLYRAMGDNSAAEPLLAKALEINRATFGGQHPAVASNLHSLAGLRRAVKNYADAESLHLQALAIERALLGEHHPQFADSLFNVAELYRETGNFIDAERLVREALQIYQDTVNENHPHRAWMLYVLGQLCAARDRDDEALPYLSQAAAIEDRTIGQIFSIWSESHRLRYIEQTRGNFSFFMSLVRRALSDASASMAIQAGLDFVLRRKGLVLESLAVQRAAVLGKRYVGLRPKLRELTTLRRQIGAKMLAGPGPYSFLAHDQLLEQWRARQESLEAELARQMPEINLEQQLRTADRHKIADAVPEGSVLIELVRFDDYDVRAVPSRGEKQWKAARYLAFVLAAGKPNDIQMIDLGEADPIDQMVTGFRESVTGEAEGHGGEPVVAPVAQSTRAPNAAGASDEDEVEDDDTRHLRPVESFRATSTGDGTDLREALFDPLLAALNGCTRLFLAPDGDLTRLPFAALPTADGRRLIDDYRISYLSAGRDVLRFGAKSVGPTADPLIAADPDYDLSDASSAPTGNSEQGGRQSRDLDRSVTPFGRLPETRKEGEKIAAMLRVQPVLEKMVLEARLKECQSPRILHIATHGFFLSNQRPDSNEDTLGPETLQGWAEGGLSHLSRLENPLLRSGLALAGANTALKKQPTPPEAEDGLLTAEDVSGLNLLGTDLVVLSACETGLGAVEVGEGVFGLRRAFVLAGAKALVMSLWKVLDRQTRDLMEDFYRRILNGQPCADALRDAQLTIKKKDPDPYYWGAFIYQGDPSPLQQHSLPKE